MNIKFAPGKPVPRKKTPTNVWRLHTRVMSGDADDYKNHHSDYTVVDDDLLLAQCLQVLLSIFKELDHNSACVDDNVKRVAVKTAATFNDQENWSKDATEDYIWGTIGSDVTCQGVMASLQEVWLTYFDGYGVEHEVELTVDGKTEGKFSRSSFRKF